MLGASSGIDGQGAKWAGEVLGVARSCRNFKEKRLRCTNVLLTSNDHDRSQTCWYQLFLLHVTIVAYSFSYWSIFFLFLFAKMYFICPFMCIYIIIIIIIIIIISIMKVHYSCSLLSPAPPPLMCVCVGFLGVVRGAV